MPLCNSQPLAVVIFYQENERGAFETLRRWRGPSCGWVLVSCYYKGHLFQPPVEEEWTLIMKNRQPSDLTARPRLQLLESPRSDQGQKDTSIHSPLITSFLHPLSPAQELQGPAVREMEMMPIRAECGPMCPLFLKERSPVGYLLAMKTEKPAMGPLGAYRLQRDKDRRRREKEQNCLTCNELEWTPHFSV